MEQIGRFILYVEDELCEYPILKESRTEIALFLVGRLRYYYSAYLECNHIESTSIFWGKCQSMPTWLSQILARAAEGVVAHVKSVLYRLQKDQHLLERAGLLKGLAPPFSLHVADSDLHGGGQFTVIVGDGLGQRIVYKSTRSNTYTLLAEILDEFVGHYVYVPPTIVCDQYSWQKFVNAEKFVPSEEILTAVGRLTFIAQLLNLYDLHPENIIVESGRLALIDTESMLVPISIRGLSLVVEDGAVDVTRSPLASSLLPSWRRSGGAGVVLQPSVVGNLLADVPNREWRECIVDGYISAYAQLTQVIDRLIEHRSDDIVVRKMHRATGAYCLFVAAAAGRAAWFGKVFEDELEGLLKARPVGSDPQLELQALLRGDIPIDYQTIDFTEIHGFYKNWARELQANKDINVMAVHLSIKSLDWEAAEADNALKNGKYFLTLPPEAPSV